MAPQIGQPPDVIANPTRPRVKSGYHCRVLFADTFADHPGGNRWPRAYKVPKGPVMANKKRTRILNGISQVARHAVGQQRKTAA